MNSLHERIAEAACCAGCPSDSDDGKCLYRQQNNCEKLTAGIEAVKTAPIWGNYLVAPKRHHIHFYMDGAEACNLRLKKARRQLEDLLHKDCSLCESILNAVWEGYTHQTSS